ncbi:MAG: hypothetical protein ACLFM0_08935 [Spirochaetales bacterium]
MSTAAVAGLVFALHVSVGAGVLTAQSRVDGEIDAFNVLSWDGGEEEVGMTGFGRGRLDLRSGRDRSIQARLTVDALLAEAVLGAPGGGGAGVGHEPGEGQSGGEEYSGDRQTDPGAGVAGSGGASAAALFTVPRASIRFRFPVTEDYTVRITTGRDRVSWGHGALFNAADVIFGADGSGVADFRETGDGLRDETAWLTALYLPLGAFAYAEPVILPALPDPAEPGARPIEDTRAGGRVSFEAGRFTLEPGYLYDPADDRHDLVLSTEGVLGIDVYAGARLAVDADIDRDNLEKRSTFSFGAYHRESVRPDVSVDARLEALLRPGAGWHDEEDAEAEYAVSVYPEVVVSPSRTVSLIGRSIISPVDRSARISGGVNWSVFGGFDMLAIADVEVGDVDSVFSWEREGAAALTTGVRYRF